MHSPRALSLTQKIVSWITIFAFALPLGFLPIPVSADTTLFFDEEATEPPAEEDPTSPSEPVSEPEPEPEPESVGEEEPTSVSPPADFRATVPPPPPPIVPDNPFVFSPEPTSEPTEEPAEPTEEFVAGEEPEEPSTPPVVVVIPDVPEGGVQPRPSLLAAALGTIGFMRWFVLGLVVIGWVLAAPRAYRMAKASMQKEE